MQVLRNAGEGGNFPREKRYEGVQHYNVMRG